MKAGVLGLKVNSLALAFNLVFGLSSGFWVGAGSFSGGEAAASEVGVTLATGGVVFSSGAFFGCSGVGSSFLAGAGVVGVFAAAAVVVVVSVVLVTALSAVILA